MAFTDSAGASGGPIDVEVRVLQRRDDAYPVELTITSADRQHQEFHGKMDAGIAQRGKNAAGDELFQALLKDNQLRDGWNQARGRSESRRVRLRIDPEAAELGALPWELMRETDNPLSASGSTPFSRYLPVALPWSGPGEEYPVRILVVISNPPGLNNYGLDPVNVNAERAVLEEALNQDSSHIQLEFLTENVTLETLEARLRKGFHVLHFVGHGMFSKNVAMGALFLQGDDGFACSVTEDKLVNMLARLPIRPMMVFLVACQSAVADSRAVFSGLAQGMVRVGVPAVIAMQDVIKIQAAQKLESTFYRQLAEHRQVDRALNEARSTLITAERTDAWIPVLYMRLRTGFLWGPGSDSNARGALMGNMSKKPKPFWGQLCELLRKGQIIPVIGPRARSQWMPTPWKVAEDWATRNEYPFSTRDDLTRVAQWLQIMGLIGDLREPYIEKLIEDYVRSLPAELRIAADAGGLSQVVEASGWRDRLVGYPNDVHRVLAGFDKLDLYLTTNIDNFMHEALKVSGRDKAKREYCRWNSKLDPEATIFNEGYAPSKEEPLVYHLFGCDQNPASVVLTEDDYFDYMAELAEFKERIPTKIRAIITTRPLMFLGYSLYDWEFRVLLHHLVIRNEKRKNTINRCDIAVQLEFKDAAGASEEAVRDFLDAYLLKKANITVFWGSTEQFIAELREESERGG